MVSFRTLTAAAAFLAPALAVGLTPAELVSSIQALTQKAGSIKTVNAEGVTKTVTDTAGTLLGSVTHFNGDITDLTHKVTAMAPIPAGVDADNVFDAYEEFLGAAGPVVTLVQSTLGELLGGVLGLREVGDVVDTASNTIGPLLTPALRVTHININGLGAAIVTVVNSHATDIHTETNNLLTTIDGVLKTVEGAAGAN
ncbi:hypothetical protein B0J18DRAFT_166259 [Chaetomium sp. MPI-SDFR-AT-0129]|uniref:Uncharacterized protein n=1 Tax=Dichotomopilus funicola TaxID=1934379 RepID=A0AAN6V1V1_9PEZI|nr:hypothetical protein B0J18DRAFT_166259 [Chaetomium sp. MPI-SDFR-AT-0129]KAK4143204.1 hypothetical protein C8A04DRAFT_29228 [Dichotomopilus funicola]